MDEDLILFIRAAIPSVWALEALLALRRDPDAVWTPEGLARELRSNAALMLDVLRRLEQAGLVAEADGGRRFSPASPAMDAISARLAQAYRQRPVAVVNAIASGHGEALRSEAFRVRKAPPR